MQVVMGNKESTLPDLMEGSSVLINRFHCIPYQLGISGWLINFIDVSPCIQLFMHIVIYT